MTLTAAMVTLEEGLALRRLNPVLGPWATIHHLLVMARVAVAAGQRRPWPVSSSARPRRSWTPTAPGCSRCAAGWPRCRTCSGSSGSEGELGEPLTGRERDVLRLLQGPLSLGEIARELHLSFNTVKTHTQAVYRKLGAHSRPEAVSIGRRAGP